MLFIESKTLKQSVDSAARMALLEKLQEKGLTPLIRSTRISCYEQALMGPERVNEMERAVAAWTETEDDRLYIRGDVFCFEDFVLFLIFGNDEDEITGIRAGIVYGAEMLEPTKKLDAFCRNVSDSLEATRSSSNSGSADNNGASGEAEWQSREPDAIASLGRFGIGQEHGLPSVKGERSEVGQARAVELLEDIEARRLLHRIRESQTEGRVSEILSHVESEAATTSLINRMADAGLLSREVLVSCRKKGRSLFRLPSPDALGVITASNATCSECGTAISDEKIEDLVKPTEMASHLLEDGSWLTTRVYSSLRELGVPDKEITVGPTSDDGEAHMMINVCNAPFLFVLRDGDVTAAQARHALTRQMETEARHLVVVASGKIQDDARERLREHARRRARGGSDVEVILIEGVDASEELRRAFERVSQRALAGELSALDASLGLSMGFIVATRFKLMQKTGALKDLAESAVGALAGSLREF
ncbi:MAG: hypothetical protein QOJ02_509 [Acidobacteriota bacterium]|jgi:hypothetical protein|nr:hypothetical protein [Acidobacteriota bacterium]